MQNGFGHDDESFLMIKSGAAVSCHATAEPDYLVGPHISQDFGLEVDLIIRQTRCASDEGHLFIQVIGMSQWDN